MKYNVRDLFKIVRDCSFIYMKYNVRDLFKIVRDFSFIDKRVYFTTGKFSVGG
jgi:hypothetical protein